MATVNHNQTLLDMAIQHLGSVSGVFQIALLNNLSITAQLEAGTELKEGEPIDRDLVKYFIDHNCIPAGGAVKTVAKTDSPEQLSGVGFWSINIDFSIT